MKLSTRSRYGARILVDLVKQANLVESVRGPKGGHMLAKKPEEITLGQIVRLFEGQSDLVECVSNTEKCNMADDCQVRLAWKDATRVLYEKLDSITIADLMEGSYTEGN
jgi:Rrf2 family protein